MLQVLFVIVCDFARLMDEKEINVIMRACVILHNIIFRDERDNYEFTFNYDVVQSTPPEPIVDLGTIHAMRLTFKDKKISRP